MLSHAYRFLRGKNIRQGRPRPPWAELVLTEADRRMQTAQETVPAITDLSHPFFSPLQQLQKYILPMALQSQIGRLMRASTDQCGKQLEAGLFGETSRDNTPNPLPSAEGEHHYTMEFQLRNTQPDLFILLINWGLRMRTRTMTFHIPFRTTLFKSFSTTNPLLELEN